MMHKYAVCLVALLVNWLPLYAQNLVPNPGFEDFNTCPTGISQISYDPTHTTFSTVDKWVNPHKHTTADYFNACATVASGVNLPNYFLGYKQARNGNGAAGIIAYGKDIFQLSVDYGEYIQCRLTQKLKAGTKYDVSFYVSYSYGPNRGWSENFIALDAIGANFKQIALSSTSNTAKYLSAIPHIISTPGVFMADTTQWVKIHGVYNAIGGEEYMTIGCFNNGGVPVQYQPVYPTIANPNAVLYAYYFIDDVSVTEIPPCDTFYYARDTTLCKLLPVTLTLSSPRTATVYQWSTGSNTRTAVITNPGIYWCKAINGCNLTVDTFRVKNPPQQHGNKKDTTVCPNIAAILKAIDATQYRWNTGDTTQQITVQKEGLYTCERISNCICYTDSFVVGLHTFSFSSLGNDTGICRGDYITLGTRYPHVKYIWNSGDTSCCIQVTQAGRYEVKAYNPCTYLTDDINIDVMGCNDCVVVPDAFTPNADGKNDYYKAIEVCTANLFEMKIYNRWGQQVFTTNNITDSWDGRYNGANADVGTYQYFIQYTPNGNRPRQLLKGTLMLIR